MPINSKLLMGLWWSFSTKACDRCHDMCRVFCPGSAEINRSRETRVSEGQWSGSLYLLLFQNIGPDESIHLLAPAENTCYSLHRSMDSCPVVFSLASFLGGWNEVLGGVILMENAQSRALLALWSEASCLQDFSSLFISITVWRARVAVETQL